MNKKSTILFWLTAVILLWIPLTTSAQTGEEERRFNVSGFIDFRGEKAVPEQKGGFVREFGFFIQNINLYFIFNPNKDLTAFLETSFLFAPSGGWMAASQDFGNTYTDNQAHELKWTTLYIERAYLEWKKFSISRVRAGRMITPYGIWSQDHGAPALISARLPVFVVGDSKNKIPDNITGLEVLGDINLADSLIASYALYIANDDTDHDSTFDKEGHADDKAFGGYLNFKIMPVGSLTLDIGGSGYKGNRTRVATSNPLTYSVYQENRFALAHFKLEMSSLPFDGRLVFQTEVMKQWAYPFDEDEVTLSTPGATDYTMSSVYAQIEYHFYNFITPYFRYDVYKASDSWGYFLGKKYTTYSAGINIRPYPQLIMKFEYNHLVFETWPGSTMNPDMDMYKGSIVMVF